MGLLDRLRNAFGQRSISTVQLIQENGTRYMAWHGGLYDADIVRACIRPKAKAVGKLVAKHIRETVDANGERSIAVNPAPGIRRLLEEPNPYMTGQVMQEKLATQLCLNNNAFALIVRDDMGLPTGIYPVLPQTAEALYSNDGTLALRMQLPNNKVFTFAYSDIIHLRQDFNEDDIFGTPIGNVLTPLLDVVSTTDQGIVNAIKNSNVIRWLLKFSNPLRPDDLKKQAEDFSNNYLSTTKGTGVAAVDSKADATQIEPKDYVPNAAQMDLTKQRIYALFNTNAKIVDSSRSEEEWNAYFDAEVEPVLRQLGGEYADGLFVSTANDNATVTNDLTIMHPMVQMGNAPTAWTASTGDYLTTAETKTEIKQTVSEIKLTASTSGTSSTIKLTAGGTEITSAQINLSGVVTFSDLSTWNQDKTIINGGNITTGQIHNLNYTTVYDLDNAWIRMGTSDGNRVYIDKSGIQWYGGTATSSGMSQGVIQNGLKTTTEGDTTIFCADTRYQKYGWWHDSSFQGITIEQVDNSVGCSGKLEVNQGIQCRSLSAWDAKNRIVRTDFGNLAINAVESPEPMFCDAGSGECDETGLCYIATEPRYRETVSETQDLRWALTPTGASAALWAEKTAFGAIVHGPAGQCFDWVCWGVQRGFEGVYADVSDAKYPEEENRGAALLDAAETEAAVSLPLTIEEAS